MIKQNTWNEAATTKAVDHDQELDLLDLLDLGGGRPVNQGARGCSSVPLSNGALRAALAFGPTRFGPSQMHVIGQGGHLALSNQKRQSP